MSNIIAYHVGPKGNLWVHLIDGSVRRATDSEWIRVWRKSPELTIRLAA